MSTAVSKVGPRQYEVHPGMSIQAAITAAAADTPAPSATAPYTVLIHPGIYTEAITMSTYVNLKGIGPKGAVVIQQTDATIITLATQVQIENLTVRLVTPSAHDRFLIRDFGVNCICRFTDVIAEITTPGAWRCKVWYFQGVSTITLERCSYNLGNILNGYGIGIEGASTISLNGCDFAIASATAQHIYSNAVAVFSSSNTSFAGTALLISANNGTFTFDNCAILCTALWTVTGATIIIRNSALECAVVAGNTATVRLKNCSYRTVSRTGTGNIVDESPSLLESIYHLMRKAWEVITATVYNARAVAGGTVTLGGAGQVDLHITNAAADIAGLESAADAAGSLEGSFTPARTPRYIQQISVSAFGAGANGNRMFFGLRETLGGVIPDITAEECAGFDWNGTNFRSISSDGGGAGVATNLTTPSTGAQHQLEVIVFGGVQVEFYVDGVLVATHSTAAGRPAVALDWQELIHGFGTGAASAGDVTLRRGGVQETPS